MGLGSAVFQSITGRFLPKRHLLIKVEDFKLFVLLKLLRFYLWLSFMGRQIKLKRTQSKLIVHLIPFHLRSLLLHLSFSQTVVPEIVETTRVFI